MDIGDKVYRYKFDLSKGEKSVDVFPVMDVPRSSKGKDWEILRCAPSENGKLCMAGLYFTKREFGSVKTKGMLKYVLLDHDGESEALALVMDYVEKRRAQLEGRLNRTMAWLDILHEWTKEN